MNKRVSIINIFTSDAPAYIPKRIKGGHINPYKHIIFNASVQKLSQTQNKLPTLRAISIHKNNNADSLAALRNYIDNNHRNPELRYHHLDHLD